MASKVPALEVATVAVMVDMLEEAWEAVSVSDVVTDGVRPGVKIDFGL